MKKLVITLMMSLIASLAYGADVTFTATEVKDSRTTGQFFAGLELKLKAIGDSLADAKGIKVIVTKAVDDTGRDLLKKDESRNEEFSKTDENNSGQAEIEIRLKNPSRKASLIKELSGNFTIFTPKKDPKATATIDSFMKYAGKPVDSATLKESGVALTIMTKKQFDEFKEQQKKEMKEKEGEMVKELGDAMTKALGSLFGSMMEIGENSVILDVTDPQSRVIDIEFLDSAGTVIRKTSTMKTGSTLVYEFEQPMPQHAALKIFIITPLSELKSEFKMSDIALP